MPGHKFNPSQLQRLDNPKRRALLPPEKILRDVEADQQSVWADIGCGAGYFTVPLAEAVEKVFALDISPEMLAELEKRIVERQINNVEVLQSEESDIPLADASVNGVILALVAHELHEPQKFLQELARCLKPWGRLIIVEWRKEATEMGPPVDHRLEEADVDSWALWCGLGKGRVWHWSNTFVGLEYIKGIDTGLPN